MSSYPVMPVWQCNVHNCGGGKCVHKVTTERCPNCNSSLVEVTTTGHKFCSNSYFCDYEKPKGANK